ncbi:hypothetical protein G7Y89_g9487 [Cudoniella acicularis]|uniref:Uncharacterized protein n=1 Tax=Cudoniella acicularis TaxID=354080 RepID=A0A8H4RGV0_9HELO|nr:hypothetical protein G7Y89_g9487 [Cudoniella acicularis]
MATATGTNSAKSIILTLFISICTTPTMLIGMALIVYGIQDQNDIGVAVGLASTSLIAGAIATAIFSNIQTNKYTSVLTGAVADAVRDLNFPSANIAAFARTAKLNTAAAFKTVPGINPTVQAAAVAANKRAYLQGTRLTFLVAVAFGLVGCICALFLVSVDGNKYTNNTVEVLETEHKLKEEKKLEDSVSV